MSTTEKTIFLYGDESHAHEIVTYAFVIIPAQNVALVELAIKEVKVRYGLRDDTNIHCRIMFNKDARAKTAYAKFTTEKLLHFLNELMKASFLAGARGWVGYLDSRNAPDMLLFESNGVKAIEKWDVRNLKTRMLFCYQAAIAPLTHIFQPTCTKAFLDGDKTKIPYFDKRRQVDTLRSFFPVEHNDTKFFPEVLHGLKPMHLELADILAYASARGLSKTASNLKNSFVEIVKSLDPGYSEVIFDRYSDGGAICKYRAYDPEDRVKSFLSQFI